MNHYIIDLGKLAELEKTMGGIAMDTLIRLLDIYLKDQSASSDQQKLASDTLKKYGILLDNTSLDDSKNMQQLNS